MPEKDFNNNPFYSRSEKIYRVICETLEAIDKRLDDIGGIDANKDEPRDN